MGEKMLKVKKMLEILPLKLVFVRTQVIESGWPSRDGRIQETQLFPKPALSSNLAAMPLCMTLKTRNFDTQTHTQA